MRHVIVLTLLVAAPAFAHPVVIEREGLSQQLRALQATLDSMQAQYDADRVLQAAPGGANLANLLRQARGQAADAQRSLRGAPIVGQPPPPNDRMMVVNQPPPPPPMRGPRPIDDGSLQALIQAINAEGFSDGKTRVIAQAARSHYFLVGQLKRIVEQLAFSADKVGAVQMIAPRLLDRQNAFQIYDAFTFSADKERVRQILEGAP
jgi:hypothetical protein